MTHLALLVPLSIAWQDPAPVPAQEPTQESAETVREPAERERSFDDLEREAAEIAGATEGGWNLEIHGYLKASYLFSEDTRLYAHRGASGFSFDAARFWVESEIAGWRLHLGYRGDIGPGIGFFAAADTTGNLRAIESTAVREVFDDVWVTLGRFRAPFVSSALHEENELLFFHRTFIGTDWDRYFNGAMVHGRAGQLRGWLSAQNGSDLFGEEVALTVRGMWDVLGGGTGYEREGAWGAPEDLALSVGGALYYDTATDDASAQAAEARLTFQGFYFGGEVVDNGEGLGDLYSWALMTSYLVLENTEVGVCLEDFDRDDSTDLYRVGLTQYLSDDDARIQILYANADSNAPLADSEVVIVGFTVSF